MKIPNNYIDKVLKGKVATMSDIDKKFAEIMSKKTFLERMAKSIGELLTIINDLSGVPETGKKSNEK